MLNGASVLSIAEPDAVVVAITQIKGTRKHDHALMVRLSPQAALDLADTIRSNADAVALQMIEDGPIGQSDFSDEAPF
jgi:hypothetical protein